MVYKNEEEKGEQGQIEDPENVDALPKEMGFEPLGQATEIKDPGIQGCLYLRIHEFLSRIITDELAFQKKPVSSG